MTEHAIPVLKEGGILLRIDRFALTANNITYGRGRREIRLLELLSGRGDPHYDPSMDDERMLLFPIYATSFCLHDFLADKHWFGAQQIIILSASSKTAIGLALALADDAGAPAASALTSPAHLTMVRGLGLYSSVHAYTDIASIDASVPAVIVDMSGNVLRTRARRQD